MSLPYNCLISISCKTWRWSLSSAETCSCTLRRTHSTLVPGAFPAQFGMRLPKRVSNYAWCKTFEQKKCICKGKCSSVVATVDGVRTCLGRAEPVLICSDQNIARWLLIKKRLVQERKLYFDRAIRVMQRDPSQECKRRLASKVHLQVHTCIISMFEPQKILMSLSIRKEIRQKWMCPLPFWRWTFMAPATSW
jgi:hypothetical protein